MVSCGMDSPQQRVRRGKLGANRPLEVSRSAGNGKLFAASLLRNPASHRSHSLASRPHAAGGGKITSPILEASC